MGEAAHPADQQIVTAGFVVIGDEILSGRTKDRNIGYLADFLTAHGIDLAEVRIVPDETDRIVEAVRALSERYTHVFTSGGIGPTHDDITADAVAAAFGVGIDFHPEAVALLSARYGNADLTQARMRMARIPDTASLIPNSVSQAPGFKIRNVHVLAGVPSVFEAMLEALGPTLAHGTVVLSRAIDAHLPEGRVADDLRRIQNAHAGVAIGSYPQYDGKTFTTQLVIRSRDAALLDRVAAEIENALTRLRAQA
ncbi:competence/damage-inducible protein A [Breoghania sp. JC706]|uniref:competence/damage-inducible protein A n=1 Tax=Breoghania sp. JC706 TaxID=3117732 RepID=UPI0030091D15